MTEATYEFSARELEILQLANDGLGTRGLAKATGRSRSSITALLTLWNLACQPQCEIEMQPNGAMRIRSTQPADAKANT